ncbi:MAG: amidase [bacterium]|nr:amidase [bacterium]
MSPNGLVFLNATAQAELIASRQISAVELMTAHLDQIERVNPKVNAICTLVAEPALQAAEQADLRQARGEAIGPLHGLPVGIKDLVDTQGIRTTYGSPIYANHVPEQDALVVTRYKQAGAIVLGKTNTPEFGAGSQTFNPVFGATCNPYDLHKTCGGSSGGAGVALACGMLPIAQGSDTGGSLRNPAAWSNVVGFRNSAGRVPVWPSKMGFSALSVTGAMGRTVRDVALQLSVIAGPDPRVPNALQCPADDFRAALGRDFRGVRVAWSRDLGRYPVEPVITQVCDAQRGTFADLGCVVEDAEPDLQGADESFQTVRAYIFAHRHAEHLTRQRDKMKQTVIWNAEQGLRLSALDVARAEEQRTTLHLQMVAFFKQYEFLCLPTTQVPPFSLEQEYPTEINGQPLDTYIDWMGLCYAITMTGCPAISVPCGFTPDGLPVGLQIVGPPHADVAILQLAHAFEQATMFYQRQPPAAAP